ncbi:MFS transporter [Actinoplanes sp. TBRC 11911]|nr:MFS transporter [Actinoplanes sp. TBRC 11911]
MGYFGPLQVLLPEQVSWFAADGEETLALAIVTGFGALVAAVTGPIAGALSDVTTSRTGRRHPWIMAGALVGGVGLVLLASQASVLGLTVAWCITQAGLNAMQAGLTAVVPDRTPVLQRGIVSGWVGLTQSVGVVAGVLVVTLAADEAQGYLLIAVLVLATAAPFVLFTTDPPLIVAAPPRFRLRFSRDHDFRWAFATRFLVQLGNAMATLYLLFFLRDRIGYGDPENGLAIVVVVYTVATVATVVVGGWISDRSGRRKPSVILSGYVMAAGALILAFWPAWPGALTAAVVLGLGFGVYLSVDQALITQVLPSADDRARDLGVINIANSAPQVLGPALAFPLVNWLGGYPSLYVAVAAVTILGSVLVTRIKAVR